MELKQPAAAGTLESGDILIELEPNEGKGLTIRLDSTVANQFGKRIKEVISETFAEMGVKDGFVDATDKGALEKIEKNHDVRAGQQSQHDERRAYLRR